MSIPNPPLTLICRVRAVIHFLLISLYRVVPFSDERLKPKRTISHVIITIAAVFLLTFLITFFIYPRSPTLELDKTVPHTIEPFSVNINTSSQRVDFVFENRWDLYNPNYFSITLASFTVRNVGGYYTPALNPCAF